VTVKQSYERGELNQLLMNAAPATADDVSITDDGRRLDSAEAVVAFFDEIRASRVGR